MSIIQRFYEVRARAQERTDEELTFTAYAGVRAMFALHRDEEILHALFFPSDRDAPPQVCGILVIDDRASPEVELIKFFIDGVHLFTLNTETDQLTEITPADDEATVWQLAALGRYFNGNSAISPDVDFLRVYRPVRAYDLDIEPGNEPVLNTLVVHLSDMVRKGVLREEADRWRRVYRLTHQGRIACSAAMHFSATFQAKSRSEFKAINRALMDM